jgi:hypothetical protein
MSSEGEENALEDLLLVYALPLSCHRDLSIVKNLQEKEKGKNRDEKENAKAYEAVRPSGWR